MSDSYECDIMNKFVSDEFQIVKLVRFSAHTILNLMAGNIAKLSHERTQWAVPASLEEAGISFGKLSSFPATL